MIWGLNRKSVITFPPKTFQNKKRKSSQKLIDQQIKIYIKICKNLQSKIPIKTTKFQNNYHKNGIGKTTFNINFKEFS
jgi:hypothetical protein